MDQLSISKRWKQVLQGALETIMKLLATKLSVIGLLGLGITTIPVSASAAEDLDYTYLELDYINLNIDQVGDSGSTLDDMDNGGGWGARGALEIAPNWFVFGQYSITEADVGFFDDQNQYYSANTDIHRLDVGAGFHSPVNAATDLVFRVAYTDIDSNGFNFGSSDALFGDFGEDSSDGYFIDGALRAQLTETFEGSLGVRYTDLQQFDNLSVIGNVMYEFSPTLGLNLGLEAGDNISHFLIGLRFSF